MFSWTYDDLKTFDPNIIQHVIPMKPQTQPFLQKLRKMHPKLESIIKKGTKKITHRQNNFSSPTYSVGIQIILSKEEKQGNSTLCRLL